MKKLKRIICVIICISNMMLLSAQTSSFNENWTFYKGEDASNAQNINFDDSKWRKLNLPHDWAIEGPFDIKYNARCGGLPFHGVAWYRRHFTMDQTDSNKVIRIAFEGAMSNAQVWVNGKYVGERPWGYIGFEFDISSFLNFDGTDNVVAVKLSPKDLSSRWYPGAGLYRNVWLKKNDNVYLANEGIFITTPTITPAKAVVQLQTEIINKGESPMSIRVKHTINYKGSQVAQIAQEALVSAKGKSTSLQYINIPSPKLWSTESPNLYKVETVLLCEGKEIDRVQSTFGVRTIEFTKDSFSLNGKKVRFKGVCLHDDNGALGTAQNRRADERKLQIMIDMGVNAIRTTHNPQSKEFLNLCDSLGLLVINEAFDVWKMNKTANDYSLYFDEWSERDLRDFIRRDRNHPSVVLWSIGNEIIEQWDNQNGWIEAKRLADICRSEDPTRPSTVGFNNYGGVDKGPYECNMAAQVDVVGMNYKPLFYETMRRNFPNMIIYGSETSSCTSSRGVYHLPIEKYETHKSLQVSSYDLISPPWAYPPDVEFDAQEKNPFVLGEFIWTGFDYLGEPTPYGGKDNITDGIWNSDWPSRSSYFGTVDLCGFPKDRFYLYQSQWTDKPMIHLLPHWNWNGMEGKDIPVYVYTNCDEAELFLNGKSLGKRVKGVDLTRLIVKFNNYKEDYFMSKYRLSWNVPYSAGELKVVGSKNGKKEVEKIIATAGKPAKIVLSADRNSLESDGKDLSYITVRIEDKDGNICPLADNQITFTVEGCGKLLAVDNGNAASTESFQANTRKAFNGLCLAIVQANKNKGDITIKATGKGLREQTIKISTK